MTTDLDLLIQLEKNNLELFISAMEELCYKPEVPVSAEDFKDPDKRRCWREDKGMEVFSFFHTDKPLGCSPKDHRFFTPPAVGIGMADFLGTHQGAHFRKLFQNVFIGLENELPIEKFHLVGETAVVLDRRIGIQIILQTDLIVFPAVAGSGVNASGARI